MKVNVFLSYCWNDSSEADRIYDYFKRNQILDYIEIKFSLLSYIQESIVLLQERNM